MPGEGQRTRNYFLVTVHAKKPSQGQSRLASKAFSPILPKSKTLGVDSLQLQ